MMSHRVARGAAAITALVLAACGAKEFPAYPVQRAEQYRHVGIKDGLVAAVHPIVDAEESRQYFGKDLLREGILALFVTFENRGESTLVVSRDSVIVAERQLATTGDLEAARGASGRGLNTGAGAVVAGGLILAPPVALIALPFALVGAGMMSEAAMADHNFAVKELGTRTVAPGRSVNGFVYAKLPDKDKIPQDVVVRVSARRTLSDEATTLDLPVTLKR